MTAAFVDQAREVLAAMEANGTLRHEREIVGAQGGRVIVQGTRGRRELVNLASNNYLGLAADPEVIESARKGLEAYGFGMASVRFICGTQVQHRELERQIADYVGKEDAVLFPACFDANGGLFEALLGPGDAIVSDALNHASIIDGARLSKARRYVFANGDMEDLEGKLLLASRDGARHMLIATDGVFSMHGHVADLRTICELAEKHGAMTMVDDCHATGHIGPQGRGTPTLFDVASRITLVTGTFGKTLGGAMGGFIAGERPIVDLLRQRARPYTFSNSLAPAVVAGTLKAVEIARRADDRRLRLADHSLRFRSQLENEGFRLLPGSTPIIPVVLGDAMLAQRLAAALDARGVYVAAFSHPVVPKGEARIRTQMSAALTEEDLAFALDAFRDAGRSVGCI